MVTETELDASILEVRKDIDQVESIDNKQVEEHLQEMGFLFAAVREKLENDKICFRCKKSIILGVEDMRVLQASQSDKGVVAFVSTCQQCFLELEKENGEKNG